MIFVKDLFEKHLRFITNPEEVEIVTTKITYVPPQIAEPIAFTPIIQNSTVHGAEEEQLTPALNIPTFMSPSASGSQTPQPPLKAKSKSEGKKGESKSTKLEVKDMIKNKSLKPFEQPDNNLSNISLQATFESSSTKQETEEEKVKFNLL